MNQIVDARTEEPIQKRKSLFCHQCRQRRPNAVGSCVTKRGTRTCAVKYCPNCLRKWYHEVAEVVALKDNWVCFKCRGICNCSLCMKKLGKKPHGLLQRKEDGVEQENSAEENHAAFKQPENAKGQEMNDSSAGCSEENAAATTKPIPEKRKKYQLKEVKIPQGIESITVSGVDLPPENAGRVLQFLQFSSTFGEAIGFRAGQAQLVVREILSGRSTRSQEHSTLTQMIIQLVTVILVDRGEISVGLSATDDSWFTVLGECLAESEVKLDEFPPEMFQKGISEYEEMDSSQRLRLLNFLCDETLSTAVLRKCMDNPESFEKEKEAKEMVKAAETKKKQFNKKFKDEMAKAQAENNGVELTSQQRLAIALLMEAESEQVFAEMQNALEMQNNIEYDDALRTKPVELDDNGRIFWKLKSYKEEPNILLQDLGSWSDVCPHEKWFAFTPEEKPQVEKYITRKRKKGLPKKKGKTDLN